MFDINQLCEDLQRLVWYEYIDRLRVRRLRYQLSRKFRHWRALPMATHAGMIQDITEYHGIQEHLDGRAFHEFSNSGWDPATSEWFTSRYSVRLHISDTFGGVPRNYAYHSNTMVHASWWRENEFYYFYPEVTPHLVWFPYFFRSNSFFSFEFGGCTAASPCAARISIGLAQL